VPRWYRVASVSQDTADTWSFVIENADEALPAFAPGQFAMLTGFGVGEVPISVSGLDEGPDQAHQEQRQRSAPHSQARCDAPARPRAYRLRHTVRAVGAVTRALCAMTPGDFVGVRGPFGTSWDLSVAQDRDVVIVAGGIGLAPLRPVIHAAARHRGDFGRVVLLVGARTPSDLLYLDEVESWRRDGIEVQITVDRPDEDWAGSVGVVTTLLGPARPDPGRSVAFVCGPDVMMRFTADALVDLGMPHDKVQVSLERTMRCGTGWCGHCQLGPLLLCRDGAVVTYDRAAHLMRVREL
jgi:NAD(P)H-flavin reductase